MMLMWACGCEPLLEDKCSFLTLMKYDFSLFRDHQKKSKLRKLIAVNLILYPNKNMILLVWKIQEESICRPISVEEFVGLQRGCPALQEEGASPSPPWWAGREVGQLMWETNVLRCVCSLCGEPRLEANWRAALLVIKMALNAQWW